MAVVKGHSGIAFEKGRFDHHEVRAPDVLGQAVGRFCVAHDDKLLAPFGRSEHVLGIDGPAVRQNDRLSFRQIFAHRTVRHAESRKAVGQKMATHLALERKREAFGIAMTHTETVDGELAGVEDPPLRQRNELQRDGRPSLAPESGEHPDDNVKRPRAAVDRHDIGALPQPQPGMPSTWSKWPCVSKSRSSLLKPTLLRSNWRCVPSPQSTMMRWPPDGCAPLTARWPRFRGRSDRT